MTFQHGNLNKPVKKTRNSTIELLRILSMFMIVSYHYSVHQTWVFSNVWDRNNLFLQFLAIWGKVGVFIFVAISCYFLIKQTDTISVKKGVLRSLAVWRITFFYSITCMLFLVFTHREPMNASVIIKALLPFVTDTYWFSTAFIMLMFLIPFLNIGLSKLKSTHIIFLTLGLGFFGPFLQIPPINNGEAASGLESFIFTFVLLTLIKREYKKVQSINFTWLVLAFLCLTTIIYGSFLYYDSVSIGQGLNNWQEINLGVTNNIFVILLGIVIFLMFLRFKEFHNRIINYLAGSMFAVYLIHDNFSPILQKWIWQIFSGLSFTHYGLRSFAFNSLVLISTVFIICVVIDLFRRLIWATVLWCLSLNKTIHKAN